MSIVLSDLAERLGTLTKLVLAEPVARIGHSRVTVRPLTLRGKAAKALFTACFASFCGGLLSCISLYFFSPLLA